MPQSYAALYCYIIFSTENREPLISRKPQPRLFVYIGGLLRKEGDVLVAADGMPDQVRLLAPLTRKAALGEVLRGQGRLVWMGP